MSYHDNARTTTHQCQWIRQRCPPLFAYRPRLWLAPERLPHITGEMPSVFAIPSSI